MQLNVLQMTSFIQKYKTIDNDNGILCNVKVNRIGPKVDTEKQKRNFQRATGAANAVFVVGILMNRAQRPCHGRLLFHAVPFQ